MTSPTSIPFVAGLSPVSPGELAALIRIDLDARWSRNDRERPEEYLRRFPSVAADAELAVDVIYAEYLARASPAKRPELAEYEARFPAFANVLSEQIRLHHAFERLERRNAGRPERSRHSRLVERTAARSARLDATFEILEQIGSGGMGVVYKARQAALNRFVALKMVRAIDAGNPELLARFRSEARVVASLHHPHIVQVYDYGEHEGLPYIAMELIEGGSLADRLDGTPWLPRTAAALLVKLAEAVQFAHERHVIHRDLKPANVLIASDAKELEVKITDFGLAKCFFDESSPHTRSYAFLGTPSYMAPEQANGRTREIGPAADIYSLGAILYELLTGQPPFRGDVAHRNAATVALHRAGFHSSVLRTGFARSGNHLRQVLAARDRATLCVGRRVASRISSAILTANPFRPAVPALLERTWRWCRRNPLLGRGAGFAWRCCWWASLPCRSGIRANSAANSPRRRSPKNPSEPQIRRSSNDCGTPT